MELLACPRCGSEWFVSSRSGARIVFQVDEQQQPVVAETSEPATGAEPINPQHICCGACTWQGAINELVESHM